MSFTTLSTRSSSYPAITMCGTTYDRYNEKSFADRMKEAEEEDEFFVQMSYSYFGKNGRHARARVGVLISSEIFKYL